jgi:hypothetical protein
MALTKAQLNWARRVYSPQGVLFCHFPVYSEKYGWGFCGSRKKVHIHHVLPQGHCKRVLNINPDFARNLIAICELHHVGRGYKGSLDHHNEYVEVIHTDMSWAFRQYAKLGRDAFNKVFEGRKFLSAKGDSYWNTDFDEALAEIAREIVTRYLFTHSDPFPIPKR